MRRTQKIGEISFSDGFILPHFEENFKSCILLSAGVVNIVKERDAGTRFSCQKSVIFGKIAICRLNSAINFAFYTDFTITVCPFLQLWGIILP